jgi:transketolase
MTVQAPRLNAERVKQARKRLLRMHYQSGVGHIGGNLSALDSLLMCFHEYVSPQDRFILSKGHSAGALYVALWSIGRIQDTELNTFHKDATRLSGHPPASGLAEVPFATGSLGHGLSLAAGTALALRLKDEEGRVFCLTSDGEWQEGSTWEALIFACHHKLNNLTVLVDHNNLQGFGSTEEVASMSPLWQKLKGFDVEVQVIDGHSLDELRTVLSQPADQFRIVVMRTVKGKGVSFLENRMDSHYLPLTEERFSAAMDELEAM